MTRERLHLEAIEEVYGNSSKVILDAEGSGNLLYLPIDKLTGGQDRSADSRQQATRSPEDQQSASGSGDDDELARRERRTRQ
ncbi:MAG: hypothetical protein U5K38_17970 [Woeseiaceae bacterium]|nr:hypothetical protein [Woeseiaceae bacterium]